jgi:hypothetical protein
MGRRPAPTTVITTAVEAVFAGWFVLTLLTQHPQRSFDRLRSLDPIGLTIPNWRFFAPEPATQDFHLMYRTRGADGQVSPWHEASSIVRRRLVHAFWFPGRRREKAFFDVGIDLIALNSLEVEQMQQASSYRLVANYIRHAVERRERAGDLEPGSDAFQFMVVLYSGYDESGDPEYRFVSGLVPRIEGAELPAPTEDRS